jgi:hypothetical protein
MWPAWIATRSAALPGVSKTCIAASLAAPAGAERLRPADDADVGRPIGRPPFVGFSDLDMTEEDGIESHRCSFLA